MAIGWGGVGSCGGVRSLPAAEGSGFVPYEPGAPLPTISPAQRRGASSLRNDGSAGPLGERVSVSEAVQEVGQLSEQFATQIPAFEVDRAADLTGVVPPDGGVASGLTHGGRINLLRDWLNGRLAVVRMLWNELLYCGLRRLLTREECIRTTGEQFAQDAWMGRSIAVLIRADLFPSGMCKSSGRRGKSRQAICSNTSGGLEVPPNQTALRIGPTWVLMLLVVIRSGGMVAARARWPGRAAPTKRRITVPSTTARPARRG